MNFLRRKQSSLPSRPTQKTEYPIGTFVDTDGGLLYYIAAPNKRYMVVSSRVLQSWAPPRVAHSTESALRNYRVASKMKFRNGSAIRDISNNKLYFIEQGRRRLITSPDVLYRLNINERDVILASNYEVELHESGDELN